MQEMLNINRRRFLQSAVATGAGLLILPSGHRAGAQAPSNKLNIALIGCWGRGMAHYDVLREQNVVALCDVDSDKLAVAAKEFPNAKHYEDWRKCLEQKDIDAVTICTLDHTHAFIANWAMDRGMHVYCEKPLGITVAEVRDARATYLKNRGKIATQMGVQRHANDNFPRVREMIRDGAIGTLQEVHAWGDRKIPRDGYPAAEGTPPASLNYDLWIGPSPFHPYNPSYFAGKAGANCLSWNMYWDFGVGQIGDMGSHTMDLVWNAIDATYPTSVQAEGDPYNPDVTPVQLTSTWENPANDWRPAIKVKWYQGGAMPAAKLPIVDYSKIDHGALFKGDRGFLVADFNNRVLLPFGGKADLTYYKPRAEDQLEPGIDHFQQQWIDACKGDLKTSCDFDYSGLMMEQLLLGLVAYRAGEKLEYDGKTGRVTNNEAANALLSREYRKGWTLHG